MNIGRRGFLGLLAGFLVAPRAKISDWTRYWRPGNLIYRAPTQAAYFVLDPSQPLPPHSGVIKAVIGQYADYYSEHDGMIEAGPGCSERLAARIAALPPGDPGKMERIARRLETGRDQRA